MYSHDAVQSARDVTIWASEFDARKVPPVCVKSGRPADGTWTFPFTTPAAMHIHYFGAKHFRLPLARGWLTAFALMFSIRSIALAIALPCWLVSLLPNVGPGIRVVATIALWIGGAAYVGYWYMQPRGSIHSLPTGQTWLLLAGVHPFFVEAVLSSRPCGPLVFSPDGRWFWDGRAWLNNDLPENKWVGFLSRAGARPWWQSTVVALVVFVAVGVLAWWSFHR